MKRWHRVVGAFATVLGLTACGVRPEAPVPSEPLSATHRAGECGPPVQIPPSEAPPQKIEPGSMTDTFWTTTRSDTFRRLTDDTSVGVTVFEGPDAVAATELFAGSLQRFARPGEALPRNGDVNVVGLVSVLRYDGVIPAAYKGPPIVPGLLSDGSAGPLQGERLCAPEPFDGGGGTHSFVGMYTGQSGPCAATVVAWLDRATATVATVGMQCPSPLPGRGHEATNPTPNTLALASLGGPTLS